MTCYFASNFGPKVKNSIFSRYLANQAIFRETDRNEPILFFNLWYFGTWNSPLAPTVWPPQKSVKKFNRRFLGGKKSQRVLDFFYERTHYFLQSIKRRMSKKIHLIFKKCSKFLSIFRFPPRGGHIFWRISPKSSGNLPHLKRRKGAKIGARASSGWFLGIFWRNRHFLGICGSPMGNFGNPTVDLHRHFQALLWAKISFRWQGWNIRSAAPRPDFTSVLFSQPKILI